MKAIVFDQFGPPEVLQIVEMAQPQPAEGEVVVRVAAATVNPTDEMMRSGAQAAMMTHLRPPFIAGMEFAGHVHALGVGVTGLSIGQAVIGAVNPRRARGGAQAQFVAVPAVSVVPVAQGVPLAAAATVPMNALTARLALAAVAPAGTLLVTGGTGMLGGSVLQLARRLDLVLVASGRDDQQAVLAGLGADMIVPREPQDLVAAVRERFPDGVDALIDGALIGDRISNAVRDGGIAVSLRKSHPIADPRLRASYVSVLDAFEDEALVRGVGEALNAGEIVPRVGARFRYIDAVNAYRAAAKGDPHGRVVLTFDDD